VAGLGQVGVWVAPEFAHLSPPSLLHLAALGRLVDAARAIGLKNWRVPERSGPKTPDALCDGPGGVWAVEVDLGYGDQRVREKVLHYKERYAGQLWGVSSRTRHRLVLAAAWPKPVEVVLLRLPRRGGKDA